MMEPQACAARRQRRRCPRPRPRPPVPTAGRRGNRARRAVSACRTGLVRPARPRRQRRRRRRYGPTRAPGALAMATSAVCASDLLCRTGGRRHGARPPDTHSHRRATGAGGAEAVIAVGRQRATADATSLGLGDGEDADGAGIQIVDVQHQPHTEHARAAHRLAGPAAVAVGGDVLDDAGAPVALHANGASGARAPARLAAVTGALGQRVDPTEHGGWWRRRSERCPGEGGEQHRPPRRWLPYRRLAARCGQRVEGHLTGSAEQAAEEAAPGDPRGGHIRRGDLEIQANRGSERLRLGHRPVARDRLALASLLAVPAAQTDRPPRPTGEEEEQLGRDAQQAGHPRGWTGCGCCLVALHHNLGPMRGGAGSEQPLVQAVAERTGRTGRHTGPTAVTGSLVDDDASRPDRHGAGRAGICAVPAA